MLPSVAMSALFQVLMVRRGASERLVQARLVFSERSVPESGREVEKNGGRATAPVRRVVSARAGAMALVPEWVRGISGVPVSRREITLSGAEATLSGMETTFSVADLTFSEADITFSVTEKVMSTRSIPSASRKR